VLGWLGLARLLLDAVPLLLLLLTRRGLSAFTGASPAVVAATVADACDSIATVGSTIGAIASTGAAAAAASVGVAISNVADGTSLDTCDSYTEEASTTGVSVSVAWIVSLAPYVCTAALCPMRDGATLRLERAAYRTMATPTPVAKKIVSICSNTTIYLHPTYQREMMTSNRESNRFNNCIKKKDRIELLSTEQNPFAPEFPSQFWGSLAPRSRNSIQTNGHSVSGSTDRIGGTFCLVINAS
jgi:hypothetical protein